MTGKQEDCDMGRASTMNLILILVLVFAFVPIDVLFASLFVQTKLKDTYAQNYDQWTGRLHKQYPPMLYFSIYWRKQGDYTSSEVQLQDMNNTRQTHKYDNKDKYNWFYLNY